MPCLRSFKACVPSQCDGNTSQFGFHEEGRAGKSLLCLKCPALCCYCVLSALMITTVTVEESFECQSILLAYHLGTFHINRATAHANAPSIMG